jgi:hypothetical protein
VLTQPEAPVAAAKMPSIRFEINADVKQLQVHARKPLLDLRRDILT